MSRRKQAKPRSLKGQNLRLNIKEDCEDVRKERSSWERRKKRDKESGRYVQKKDKDVKEHRCAESLQVSESFTQQRLKFCHGAVKPDVEEDAISCLGLSLSSGDSSPEHKNGCDLGVKEEDLPKCSKEETHRDHQWLGQCGKTNTPFPGSSLVPFPEIFPKHFSSDTSTNSKQTCTSQYNLASALPFHHLSDINDPQNHLGSCEKMQLSTVECACTSKTTLHSSQSSPATPMTADLAFKPATSCAEKRKSLFLSNNSFGIQFTKQLKVFNSCVHCHNHMDPKACRQTQLMDIEVPSGQLYSEIPAVSSKLKEQQKDADVMLGHSVLLEAAITAAVETVLQCSFCPKSLTGPKALQEHVRQSHNSSVIENNVFFCSECFRGFLTKDTLENHVQQTHCKKQSQSLDPDLLEESAERKSLLFCPYCTHLPTFSSKLKLIQHVKITHKNINLINLKEGKRTLPQSVKGISEKISQCVHPSTDFICDHCGAKYTSLDLFQTHLGSHLKSMLPKFTCPECFKDFPNRESLDKHTVAHFSNTSTLHICESCSKSFTNVKDLQGHLLEMHTIVFYRCALCQQVFSSKVSIEVHLATKHSNKRTTFHCTSCEWDFKQEHDLHLHIKRKHLDKQCKIYCCIFCAESFNTDIELQCHITTHSDKSSPCVCTKTNSPIEVPLHGNLSAKSQSAEGDNVTPPPVSEPVAKDGTGRLPVNNEIRDGKVESLNPPTESKGKVNMSDPMFACEICGASYTMQSLLTNHQLRDHHIQPGESGTLKRKVEAIQGSHKCKDCSKTFFTEMALWEHVQTHLGPTKHCQCPICGERFPSLLTLTEHKVTHSRSLDTGNCRICKLPLHSEEDFLEHCQRHPDLHNSLTGFRCVVCMQTVTSTIELKIHGTFHMQKVQGIGLINSCTDPANQNPDLKISSSVAQQEMVNMDVSKFEHRLRDSKTNISVVNCCLATALNPDERSTKNTLAQTTTV